MRKVNQMILALLLCVAGAMNVSAGERVDLSASMWHSYDGFGADASALGTFEAAWSFDTPSSCPIGDTSCNAWADLGNYSKLYVVMEGCDDQGAPNGSNPRIFINRLETEGQFNADKSAAKCLVIPNAGTWAEDYYTIEDNEYVIDLVKIKRDFGFVHFHSIKGSSWNTQVIVNSLQVEKAGAGQQVGWTSVIENGDLEGDDVSSFFVALDAVNNSGYEPATISDGVGKDGSRGIAVTSIDNPTQTWATQFFIKFNEPLLPDAKWRISFDYKADMVSETGTGCHGEPRAWQAGGLFSGPTFDTDWQTFTAEGTITAEQAGENGLGSIAFDLNNNPTATTYYFDNIKFEVYKSGTMAEYSNDVILVNFGYDTNIPELVQASGATRIFFDDSCAKVKVNGVEAAIYSIEGLADGRFYIFLEEAIDDENAIVEVTVTNTIGLVYASGPNSGNPVENFLGIATYNDVVAAEDGAYPYDYVTPTVMKTDPDNGSFNLDASTTFTIYFDKEVDCAALEATANGSPMSVSPSSGFAKEVTLSGGLSDGECTIKIDKIYPEMRMADEIFGTYEFTVSIGKTSDDPNDQPYEVIPASYFANCAANAIPEGFFVKFGEEDRPGLSTAGSGPRMFNFAAGGDFTKGLYIREGYAEYGSTPGYELALEAGKKYVLTFNSAMWKASGTTLDLKIFNANDTDTELFSQTVNNTPDVNGNTSTAVSGSTKTSITFVPETDGNYIVRWDRPGFNEILIANVVMKYMPNKAGLEYILMLNTALDEAKAALEANSDSRYQGEAFSNLQSIVSNYENWESTSPSAYQQAADEIAAATQALKDYRALCDEYDTQIKKAIDVVRQNEMPNGDPAQATKFVKTELFQQLKGIVAKYNGTSEWRNMNEDPEGEAQWQLFYEYNILTGESELRMAVDELTNIANLTSLLFTEGVSAPENANGGKATGVAVLIDRLRQGADALVSLGIAESEVKGVRNALTDDDDLADLVKEYLKAKVYNELNNPETELFQEKTNEETMETYTDPVDMTVFVKNPNTYKQLPNMDFTTENVPGWITPDGYNRPGLTAGWGQPKNVEGVAEDVMFQTWGSSYRVQQTINDLPVGIYTVRFAFGERNNGDAGVFNDSYAYVMNAAEEMTQSEERGQSDAGDAMYIAGIGQSFPFASNDAQTVIIEGVQVAEDGVLTIGVNAGPASHTFFNEVRLLMTAPLPGYQYPKMDYPTLPKDGIQGDVNADGAVDVADISNIITIMAEGTNDKKGDVNGDGTVDVADISNVITIMANNARLAGLAIGDDEEE